MPFTLTDAARRLIATKALVALVRSGANPPNLYGAYCATIEAQGLTPEPWFDFERTWSALWLADDVRLAGRIRVVHAAITDITGTSPYATSMTKVEFGPYANTVRGTEALWRDVNSKLAELRHYVPTGAYDKVNMVYTFADGLVFRMRLDVAEARPIDAAEMLNAHLGFHAGVNPGAFTVEDYRAYVAAYVGGAAEVASWYTFMTVYDVGPIAHPAPLVQTPLTAVAVGA
jgi:hypothetical protein